MLCLTELSSGDKFLRDRLRGSRLTRVPQLEEGLLDVDEVTSRILLQLLNHRVDHIVHGGMLDAVVRAEEILQQAESGDTESESDSRMRRRSLSLSMCLLFSPDRRS